MLGWSAFSRMGSSPLAAGPASPVPALPGSAPVSECSGPRRPGQHHRPRPPHRTAGVLPSPSRRAVRVLTGSQGPRSAACIGLLHLNQFPVSIHLGSDQGAEGVQVTSRTRRDFPETKRTADEYLLLRTRKGLVARAKSLLHRRTPPRDPLLQDVSQGPAGP